MEKRSAKTEISLQEIQKQMEESVRPLNFSVGTMRNNDEGKVPEEARRRERAEALSERPIREKYPSRKQNKQEPSKRSSVARCHGQFCRNESR